MATRTNSDDRFFIAILKTMAQTDTTARCFEGYPLENLPRLTPAGNMRGMEIGFDQWFARSREVHTRVEANGLKPLAANGEGLHGDYVGRRPGWR